MRSISLASPSPTSYGILKTNRVGGALLYGPPGTGKTHLARVLAKISGAAMLNVSVADIESKWVGEPEKSVKALFNLGKLLSPCIIFMHEADSLFRCRSGSRGSSSSHHDQLVNQLLQESDGLSNNEKSPFLLLATNHPHHLDEALLRRIPTRFYIGLPSEVARQNLFCIFLREELLAPHFSLKTLATTTRQYTGSDIKHVCVEAALICQGELEIRDIGVSLRRGLTMEHFEKALKRIGPNSSDTIMQEVLRFSENFDPSAVLTFRLDMSKADGNRKLNRAALSVENSEQRPEKRLIVDNTPINSKTSTNPAESALRTENDTLSMPIDMQDDKQASPQEEIVQLDIPETSVGVPSVYAHRDTTLSEISLLEIVDLGSSETTNQCVLHKVSLDHKPSFTALSYVWGDVSSRQKIMVNGMSMDGTQSLASAIRWAKHHWAEHFPHHKESEFRLWADALCINQEDIEERSLQVQIMGKIYSGADLVLSSLGTDNIMTELALRVYGEIHRVLTDSYPRLKLSKLSNHQWLQRFPSLCEDDMDLHKGGMHVGNSAWLAIRIFQELPYWNRVWIVQEAVLAKEIVFFYDESAVDFDQTVEIADILRIQNSKDGRQAFEKPDLWPLVIGATIVTIC